MSEPRTVTVRIPLVIDSKGHWYSDDWRKTDKGRTPQSFGYYNMSRHWITAEVPVPALAPAPTEIAGRAEHVEPSHD
jgi:hypothetical protein